MDSANQVNLDIDALLVARSATVRMQPIVSIRRNALIGVEALGEGIAPDGSPIMADLFFDAAQQQGRAAEVDALCLEIAFERFLPMLAQQSDLVLFVNVSRSTLTRAAEGIDLIGQLAARYGVDPRNITVEIPEFEYDDITVLQRAIRCYNETGMLVALDDIGVKQSNLDRIVALHPDMLKLDRSLLHGVDRDSHKQEVVKAIVRLSERIGGWVITEGIEHEREALAVLDLGGDLMQGYYFGVPGPFDSSGRQATSERIERVAHRFKKHALEVFHQHQDARAARLDCARDAVRSVEVANVTTFDDALQGIIEQFPLVQSACVLDANGVQISDTRWRVQHVAPQKTIIFHPPTRGTDHSLKEYVYVLEHVGTGIYESVPYVPLPTSTLCITISCLLRDADGLTRILCLHMEAD